ncbi:MAG: alpha/beta hydrolase [Polaromonas sp.]|nr:alpha/beta hydrolase [Polaromonas sp.]
MMLPFTARDGENLALYEWPLGDADEASDLLQGHQARPIRGLVLMVHGLGEHALLYQQVAAALMGWGFTVRAYDQRGHGRSGGAPGLVPTDNALLDDLAEIVGDARLRCRRQSEVDADADAPKPRHERLPLILLGHSLGGLLAARFVALNPGAVDGLVLSSPAFDLGLGVWRKLLLALLPGLAPDLTIGNGLDPRDLCRDPQVVARYRADPLVHGKLSPRLARFMVQAGRDTLAAAPRWVTPTLLMYAGADRIVSPAGSDAFARSAALSPGVKPGTLTVRCFSGFHHELFNEPEADLVFSQLRQWLDEKTQARNVKSPIKTGVSSY